MQDEEPEPAPPEGSGPEAEQIMPPTRGPAWLAPTGEITCEIEHPTLGWIPFTASPADTVYYGPMIHAYWLAHPGDLTEGAPPE